MSGGSISIARGFCSSPTTAIWRIFLAHPRNEFEREYRARVDGELSQGEIEMMLAGEVEIPPAGGAGREYRDDDSQFEEPPQIVALEAVEKSGEGRNHWYRIVVREGRNRLVRRVFAAYRLRVNRLLRVPSRAFRIAARFAFGRVCRSRSAAVARNSIAPRQRARSGESGSESGCKFGCESGSESGRKPGRKPGFDLE